MPAGSMSRDPPHCGVTSSFLLFPELRFFFQRRGLISIECRDKLICTHFLLVLDV